MDAMGTIFNRKVQEHKPARRYTDWQEKLPVKPLFAGFLVLLAVAALVLVNNPTRAYLNSAEMDILRARGILRVGVDDEVAGLYQNGEGLEREIAEAIGEVIFGQDDCIELVPVSRQTIEWKLEDGEADFLLMSKTTMDDADAYVESAQAFYTDPCVLMGYAPTDDLTEKRIAVLRNTEAHACLRRYETDVEPELIIVPYAAYYDMLVALRAGSVDAVCMTRTQALTHMDEGFRLYGIQVGVIPYHAIAPIGSETLIHLVSELLVGWRNDGTLASWCQKYDLGG